MPHKTGILVRFVQNLQNMKRNLIYAAFALCLLVLTFFTAEKASGREKPQLVIFDTDIGNDVDDVMAMDILYKYADAGKIKLLAIMGDKDSPYTSECIDIMNTWYGYPRIPVGAVENGVKKPEYKNYAKYLCELRSQGGGLLFERGTDGKKKALTPAHILYRKILAAQPDSSVTVVAVGFSTNLARLLDTPADSLSPLDGRSLVARKVRLLSVMGGDFAEKPIREYNIVNDIPAAQEVFSRWPGKVVVSPFGLGQKIRFPGKVMAEEMRRYAPHPVAEAYVHYRPMPYDRQTWDLTSVLYALEPDKGYFHVSSPGTVVVHDDGVTSFHKASDGRHFILSVDEGQAESVKRLFVKILTSAPRHRR